MMASRRWLLILIFLGAFSCTMNLCTVPLVGFAAIAVSTLSRRQGVICLSVIWAVNQGLGFGLRGYPLDMSTVAWGVVMLGGALFALVLGHAIQRGGSTRPLTRPANFATRVASPLLTGFLAYELILWLANFQLGTVGGFAPAVLGSVLLTNGLWALGLSLVFGVGDKSGWLLQSRRRSLPLFE